MPEAWKHWEGQVVNGKFHLRQYLGGSERSAVFLTEHGDQKTAIKLIPADPANAYVQLSRWGVAARLSHPRLIRLLDMGRCQLGPSGLLFVVMEYAEENLSQILPQRRLTPREARDMLQPVLGALAYLHGEGFVHSHLQPTNIMAVADQLKISSDGLRRAGESGGDLGRSRVYEPPEAATGAMSPAGDVWSLGITLVEALTQQAPVWKEKEQAGPALPGDLPSPFLEIARDCLHRDPRRRSTLADIAAQLQLPSPVAEKQAVPQKQTPSGQEKTVAKKRYLFPVVVAVLALLVILAIPRILNHPEAPPTQFPQEARDKDPQQTSAVPAPAPKPEAAATPPTGLPLKRGVVHQVVPDVPQSARDTIQGRVRVGVRVAVDSSGSVVDATLDSPGPSRYFARLALQAARGWRFTPAQGNGQGAASEWILRFEFGPTDTRVIPVPVSP